MLRTIVTTLEGKLGSFLRYGYYGPRLSHERGYFTSMPGFVIEEAAKVAIGRRCGFNRGVYITASRGITIGDDVIIGAYTVLRDADHGTEPGITIKDQPLKTDGIWIGNDVWIGAHCVILKGTVIGNGAVIGANSLVKGKVPANEVWVGSPARKLRSR